MQEGGKLVLSVEGPGKASLEKVRLRVWRVYGAEAEQAETPGVWGIISGSRRR